MGNSYEHNRNMLNDFLLQLQLLGNDIAAPEFKEGIEENTMFMLQGMGIPYEDLQYLDFKLKKDGEIYVRVMAHNIVSALWFSGIFPENCESAFLNNSAVIGGIKYKFNKRTKRLSWERIKE